MALRFRILAAPAELGAGWTAGSVGLPKGPSKERAFEIASELDELRIGRQPGTEIELPFPAVSSLHARMFRGELSGDWWVEDAGSMNGTWVDGRRLSPRRPVAIRAGQRVRIATVDLIFEGWSVSPRGAESTATIARRLISDLFGVVGGEVPALAVELGPARPSCLRLSHRDRRYLAGRADGCDLVLLSEHASREHAAFIRRWDGVVVRDLGSKNGVLVNGKTIPGETRLSDGDRIAVGPVAIRLTDPEDRYLQRMASLESESSSTSAAEPARAVDAAFAPEPRGTGEPNQGAGPIRQLASTPTGGTGIDAAPGPASVSTSRGEAPVAGVTPAGPLSMPSRRGLAAKRWKWLVSALAAAIIVLALAGLIILWIGTG
jgi:pSer/pThr/pTyr-binding forkhead associated (FHA) protein